MTKSINTYGYLFSASSSTLKKAQEEKEGSFYQYMSSLMFSAFTIEAYFNHIGSQLFECWDDLESIRPTSKLNVISNKIDLTIDKGKRPYQSLTYLFKFRNDLAHGKTTFFSSQQDKKEPWWIDFCTENNAKNIKEDIVIIIKEINDSSGIKDPWALNHESY